MKKNIYYPSFKLERKTKAFNISLWGFVGLISMFSTFLFAVVPYLFLSSLFEIVSTFILDNLGVIFIVSTMIFALIFGVGCYKFLNMLLHSYKFEDNKIIKGRIVRPDKVKDLNLAFDTIMTNYMLKNITNSKAVIAGNATINMNNIINLIRLNLNQEFVNNFFDTDIYQKKIYNNPRLLKDTRYSLIYLCDNNKKLVIKKIYEGMNITINSSRETSLLSRIFIRSLIILLVFFLFGMLDLFIGINNNNKYKSNINNTCSLIQTNLNNYGYSITKNCNFEKVVSDSKTSTIKYNIDKNGNIINIHLELYYDILSYSASELKYIISTLNTDFSDAEINSFIERVNSCFNGSCSYGKFKSLRIGSSDGFINIHNY